MILQYFIVPLTVGVILLMYRVVVGPTIPDRLLAIDTATTLIAALMILIAIQLEEHLLVVAAIALALLSYLGTMVFAKYLEGKSLGE
jgi:multicomponent Na+:H+ antiporter subunit F